MYAEPTTPGKQVPAIDDYWRATATAARPGHSPAQSWKSSAVGATRRKESGQASRFLQESRAARHTPIRPSRSRQGLTKLVEPLRPPAPPLPRDPCQFAYRRNVMGMARRLGAPLASESSGQRFIVSAAARGEPLLLRRGWHRSTLWLEVRSIVASRTRRLVIGHPHAPRRVNGTTNQRVVGLQFWIEVTPCR